jgi:hypothetical protein
MWIKREKIRTEAHAGPETRTTAIAALPGAVDNAYIVESASSMNRRFWEDEKLRTLLEVRCGVRAEIWT